MKSQFERLKGSLLEQLNSIKSLVQSLGGPQAADATRDLDLVIAGLDRLVLALQRYRSASGRANFDQAAQQGPVREVVDQLMELTTNAGRSVMTVTRCASSLLEQCGSEEEQASLKATTDLTMFLAEMLLRQLQLVLAASVQSAALAIQPLDVNKLRRFQTGRLDRPTDTDQFVTGRGNPDGQGVADW